MESVRDSAARGYLHETSSAHMARVASEARSVGVERWSVDHVDRQAAQRPTAPNGSPS